MAWLGDWYHLHPPPPRAPRHTYRVTHKHTAEGLSWGARALRCNSVKSLHFWSISKKSKFIRAVLYFFIFRACKNKQQIKRPHRQQLVMRIQMQVEKRPFEALLTIRQRPFPWRHSSKGSIPFAFNCPRPQLHGLSVQKPTKTCLADLNLDLPCRSRLLSPRSKCWSCEKQKTWGEEIRVDGGVTK